MTYVNVLPSSDRGLTRVQKAREELVCPICIETFREPRTLTCQHTFCTACLKKLIAGARKHSSTANVACPECRSTIILPESGINGEFVCTAVIIVSVLL